MRYLLLLLTVGLLVPNPVAADELNPDLPGAEGVPLEPWTSSSYTVEGSRVVVSIPVPEGWEVSTEGRTILVRPTRSENDLGLLFVLRAVTEVSPMESIQQLASEYFEAVSAKNETGSDAAEDGKVLGELEAQFPDGRPAGLLGMNTRIAKVELVALAGSSKTVFSPWKGILQDILRSSTIAEAP